MRLTILIVLICAPYFVCGQTAREIANNPNNFHMFENFELTKSLYTNETKIVNKLMELRANLVKKQKILTKLLENSFENESDYYKSLLQVTILALTKKLTPVKSVSADIHNLSEELPNANDYAG
jgi:DNA-binding winged helix-turn-helix (wHTH) protein